MKVHPVRVVYEKWDGRPHWEFDTVRLGDDVHGTWLGVVRGTPQARPGASVTAAEDHVVLVAKGGEHCATFYADPGRDASIEVYVDVTCAHRWSDERITMVDLDLDVIRHWNGPVVVDDEDEFAEHRVLLAYPDDVVARALATTKALEGELERRSPPFEGATSERWLTVLRSCV